MASMTITCNALAGSQISRQQLQTARPSCSMRVASSTTSRSASLRTHRAAFRSAAQMPNMQSASRSRAAGLIVRAEQSYVMIKPDGVQRGLVGEVISRLERKGFKLIGLKMETPSRELAEEHYKDLSSKPFFPSLVDYIISGPVVCMVWEGDGVIPSIRKIVGATNPVAAEPGTIRGDYARVSGRNIIHASDSPDNGVREAELWFGKDAKLEDWTVTNSKWLVE